MANLVFSHPADYMLTKCSIAMTCDEDSQQLVAVGYEQRRLTILTR